MATKKASTKKDLENKIAELEAKLNKLSTELETPAETKPAETKPAETKPAETKPAEAPKPEERPAATTKPKGTLPKGFETKPAEAKPAEAPKPEEDQPQPQNQKVHYQKDLRQNQQKLNPPKLQNHLKHKHNHQQPLLKHWRTHTMMHQ